LQLVKEIFIKDNIQNLSVDSLGTNGEAMVPSESLITAEKAQQFIENINNITFLKEILSNNLGMCETS
jgi:hypothetical protein